MVSTLVRIKELVRFLAQDLVSNLVYRRDMNIYFPNTSIQLSQ